VIDDCDAPLASPASRVDCFGLTNCRSCGWKGLDGISMGFEVVMIDEFDWRLLDKELYHQVD
jgi:hypothetical protein